MAHPLVDQLRFTRSEWVRALEGVSDEEAVQRILPMNSISWIIGHLTWQESRYLLIRAQGIDMVPELGELVGNGAPASTPPLKEMWEAWHMVTQATEPYLDTYTAENLQAYPVMDGETLDESFGTLLLRMTYHYWFHMGEILAIRQVLGHRNLPEFVGDIGDEAPYRPD